VRQRTPWLVRLRRARMILTVSEAVRREVIEHFGVSPDLVRAIPLAASPHFRPLAPTSPAPQPFFLFVATLEPRKNVAGLIEGWRESHAETGADLVIAGRNRADFTEIPASEGLHFLGEVPDVELPRLYSDALAFVYPTLYEGFGLPVLEAMQCGCPVITSRDPAVMEVTAGNAIHTSSAHEIADAMRAKCPRSVAAQLQSSNATTASSESPLVSRCVNSIRVLTLAACCITVPLQSGQWLPQPAPAPVARTKVPHRITATKYAKTAQAKLRSGSESAFFAFLEIANAFMVVPDCPPSVN